MQRSEWPTCLLRLGSGSIGALGMRGLPGDRTVAKGTRMRRAVQALRIARTALGRAPLQELSRGLGVAMSRNA